MALQGWQKIQIAGLFHGIGTIGKRAEIALSKNTESRKKEYSHLNLEKHVLWNIEFFNKVFGETLPTDIEDIVKCHLNSDIDKNNEAKYVQEADIISLGYDKKSSKEEHSHNDDSIKLFKTCFAADGKDRSILIRPHPCDEYSSLQNLGSNSSLDVKDNQAFAKEIKDMYVSIWDDLVNGFGHIWSNHQNNPKLLMALLCEMQRKYLTWVPITIDGVSLYDHQRTTAGFAHCLSEDQEKCHYLLIEVSGVQKFIYSVYKTKQATKILRGKSTFVDLISEIITHRLSSLSVSYANILLNTKGKISYLLPATIKGNEIHKILDDFQKELHEKYGHLIGLDYLLKENVKYTKFQKESFKEFKQDVNSKIQKSKFQPLKHYGDKAWSQINQDIEEINGELCRYCKEQEGKLKQDQDKTEEDHFICDSCEKLIKIGEKDVKHDIRVFSTQGLQNAIEIFNGVYLNYFQDTDLQNQQLSKNDSLFSIQVLKESSDFKFLPQNQGYFSTPIKESGDVLSFEDMNKNSVYLAIVKADVDDLGQFIIQNTESTGELASLSHQIQWFFRGRSQQIIQDQYKDKIYPVYLAGDDFFLIGNHDVLPEFLRQIRSEFKVKDLTYSQLGWSCAYQLFTSHTPLLSLAEGVEDCLNQVKNRKGKNKISHHSEMMEWEDLNKMLDMWNQLKDIAKGVEDSMGLFRRLLQFAKSARRKHPTRHDLLWPAYYNYYLQRQFPPKNGVQNETFSKIENIFKVLENHGNSPMKEFYTGQAIEFYLLDQRIEEEKENECSKSA